MHKPNVTLLTTQTICTKRRRNLKIHTPCTDRRENRKHYKRKTNNIIITSIVHNTLSSLSQVMRAMSIGCHIFDTSLQPVTTQCSYELHLHKSIQQLNFLQNAKQEKELGSCHSTKQHNRTECLRTYKHNQFFEHIGAKVSHVITQLT